VRLLTNLETNTRKLLRVILVGQPELLDLLARPDLRQVEQRVVARYHLTHLSKDETAAYVTHRLHVSGAQSALIPDRLFGMLYRATRGVPRLINVICDRALLGAYVRGKDQVNRQIMRNAIQEARGGAVEKARPWGWLVAFALLAGLALGLGYLYQNGNPGFDFKSLAQAAAPARMEPAPAPSTAAPLIATQAPAQPAVLPFGQAMAWPATVAPEHAEYWAYTSLAGLFGERYSPEIDLPPCRQMERIGLRCLTGNGDLFTIRYELNLPALLQWQQGALSYYVLLSRIEGDRARLLVGGEQRDVSVDDLARYWRGNYVALWRPPPGYSVPIGPHAGPQQVTWLQDALVRARIIPQSTGSTVFDADLALHLREFQGREGIHPDGLAGPYTLIRLSQRMDPQGVRLVTDGSH
jgi:general secretion pathway protein A